MFDLIDIIIQFLLLFILIFGMFCGVFVFYHSVYKNRDIWDDGGLRVADGVRAEMQDIKKAIEELSNKITSLKNEKI